MIIFRYCSYHLVVYIYIVAVNRIGLVRRNEVSHIYLAVLRLHHRIYFRIEITHVIHLPAQLLHTCIRQVRVIDHRRLAHLKRIARQCLIRLRRRVQRSRVIYIQLQFPETENLRILLLTKVWA